MNSLITQRIKETLDVMNSILSDVTFIKKLEQAAKKIYNCLNSGGTVFFCGNGGSAADAQHLAAELQGRFFLERRAFSAIAITTNTSILTAIANDYGYSKVFVRQIEGLGRKGDILVGISTSGNSRNIIEAFNYARKNGIVTIAFTGRTGGKMAELSDIHLNVPSESTPRIQEAHIMIGHIICEIVEKELAE